MSFWNTSDGGTAVSENKEYEVEGGGGFDPIPEGSNVLAMIEEAKWQTVQNGTERHINIKWTVLKPDTHANRKIFHKLWVADLDPSVNDIEKASKKKDRQLRMFSAIDSNAGGRLSKLADEPTNEQLAIALHNKMMVIGLGLWETNDGKSGNWVRSVADKTKDVHIADAKNKPTSVSNGFSKAIDDEIPF